MNPRLFLHTICSNNYAEISRMTENYLAFDGIVAMYHIPEEPDDGTYEILEERKRAGKIIRFPFLNDFSLSRNICLRYGVIREGDYILVLDTKEYVNPEFLEKLRTELLRFFENQNIGAVYQYSKCVLFKYYRDITYFLGVHTGVRGFRGKIIDLAQYDEYKERKNWIWSERDNELSWVVGSKYYFFPDSNHINLVYEAHRFPNHPRKDELWKDHAEVRLKFFDFCRTTLGFEATQDNLIKYLSELKDWIPSLIEFFEFEKILKTFYRYYVLKQNYKDIFETEDTWLIKKHLKNE